MRRRGNKYRAKRTEYNGETYDSKAEAAYAAHLDTLKRLGMIGGWERGKSVILVDGPSRYERITYKPDFFVWGKDGVGWHVDVKGAVTEAFRLRAILWKQRFPQVPLKIVSARDGLEMDLFSTKRRKRAA